jgi:hypothetical protein
MTATSRLGDAMFDLKQIEGEEKDSPWSYYGPVQREFRAAEEWAIKNKIKQPWMFATIVARHRYERWKPEHASKPTTKRVEPQ